MPGSFYQYTKSNDAFVIGTFGKSIIYDFQITDTVTNVRAYNLINNIRSNNTNYINLVNYKNETFNNGMGPVGFYNSIINKMYVVDRTGGGDPYYHSFNIFDIKNSTVTHFNLSNSNYVMSTYPDGGAHVYQYVIADSSTLDFVGNGRISQLQWCRVSSTFSFQTNNHLKYIYKQYDIYNSGLFGNSLWDTNVYGSYTPYSIANKINDTTMLIHDDDNNIYEVNFTGTKITANVPPESNLYNYTKTKSTLDDFRRLYIPPYLMRLDHTTT